MKYILAIDQSTQGTKGLLFDEEGSLLARTDLPHRQIVNDLGWVGHDAAEIMKNTYAVGRRVIEKAGIDRKDVAGIGISNQRETAMAWDRVTGEPLYDAVVWQCARGKAVCDAIAGQEGAAALVQAATGLPLSPYFSAGKLAWLLANVPAVKACANAGAYGSPRLAMGTMDAWLIYNLTEGRSYRTDYSNASRTQLFNIFDLKWDEKVCALFGIDPAWLPEVCPSDSLFGETTWGGWFDQPVPIHGVLGDSHGALFGQGCLAPGMTKSTFGTGSSVMMNIGTKPVVSRHGLVTSLAWNMGGKTEYVLEGNINYTGAVITWLQKDVKLIAGAGETEALALSANPADQTYLVPAFSGLGAPYWDPDATGVLSGITRTTGQAEIVRAALDCIGYQIHDIVAAMGEDAGIPVSELRVDGGPTKNRYLMQFVSDMTKSTVEVPDLEELSGLGAALACGRALGLYGDDIFEKRSRTAYRPQMEPETRSRKLAGWKRAVGLVTDR